MKPIHPKPQQICYICGLFLLSLITGCSDAGSSSPSADTAPFEAAVASYLDQNNMGMALKQIKSGPHIDGATATMTASLTRAQVGGPSVTWEFNFEQDASGGWKAVKHNTDAP